MNEASTCRNDFGALHGNTAWDSDDLLGLPDPSQAGAYKLALPSLQSGLDALLGHDSTLEAAS